MTTLDYGTAELTAAIAVLKEIEAHVETARRAIFSDDGVLAEHAIFEIQKDIGRYRATVRLVGAKPIDVRAAILEQLNDTYLTHSQYLFGAIHTRDPHVSFEEARRIANEMVREGLIKWASRGGGHAYQYRRYKPGERPARAGDKNLPFGHPLADR